MVARGFDAPWVAWGAGHRGVDLAAAPMQEVRAPADGMISYEGMLAGRPVLVVSHGELRSTFEPVVASEPLGARVVRGQPVGRVGAEPGHCAPATCLHWGVLRGDGYLDPLALVAAPRVRLFPPFE